MLIDFHSRAPLISITKVKDSHKEHSKGLKKKEVSCLIWLTVCEKLSKTISPTTNNRCFLALSSVLWLCPCFLTTKILLTDRLELQWIFCPCYKSMRPRSLGIDVPTGIKRLIYSVKVERPSCGLLRILWVERITQLNNFLRMLRLRSMTTRQILN